MAQVLFPLTGAGDATAAAATDLIGGVHYQRLKIFDGTEGSTVPITAKATTPGAADPGMVVRPIGSTAFLQGIAGTITVGNPTTAVDALALIANPTTAVTITNPSTAVTVTNPTTAVNVANPTTAVDAAATLTSLGSTRLVGQMTVANPTTAVTVSSGVILGAGSTTNALGAVALLAGTSANMLGTVAISSATTAITVGSVALLAGTSVNMLGAVVVGSGTTAITLGAAALLGSTNITGANYQQGAPLSSVARVATSLDVALLSSNTAQIGVIIFNESTGSLLYVGFSTAVVTSAAYNYQVPPGAGVTLGWGGLPLYYGPIRGRLQSTTIAGIAVVTRFTT